MPSDRNQTQKNTYSFTEMFIKSKLVYRDKIQISGSLGLGTGDKWTAKEFVAISLQDGL